MSNEPWQHPDLTPADVLQRQLTPDDPGRHNANPQASADRFITGASWKKQDIVILLPAAKMVPSKCFATWWSLIFPPNNGVVKIFMVGQEVGEAYSNAVQMILDNKDLSKFPYILTIEHDQTVPQDGVLKLAKHMDAHPEFDCISGLYWTKGEGGAPQIWGDINDPSPNYRPQPPAISPDGVSWQRLGKQVAGPLVECCGTGMGFALWRTSMFKDPNIPKPFFRTIASSAEGVGTQDLYFWGNARKYGHRCAVACDVAVGHYDVNTDQVW